MVGALGHLKDLEKKGLLPRDLHILTGREFFMSHPYQLIVIIFLVFGLATCGDSGSGDAESTSALSDEARFDKDIRKNGCMLLTAKIVSATFDVPADKLRQMKIMGCRYSWGHENEVVEAGLSMIRAHKSEESAARWFGNATKSKTAEEMKAEMDKVTKRMDAKAKLDTKAKSMAKGILGAVGSKAVNFEDIAGVGEEARVNDDGNVFVRVDNLTFIVSAYKGAKAPPPDLKGVDLKQMVAVATENANQWTRETAPQRKKDGTRLARAIVAGL